MAGVVGRRLHDGLASVLQLLPCQLAPRFARMLPATAILLPLSPRRNSVHTSARGAQKDGTDTMRLQIANPAMILSGIATRYESSTRILMEYVDNSLDSAEQTAREGQDSDGGSGGHGSDSGSGGGHGSDSGSGAQATTVHVAIDHKRRSVWIRDNCAGMGASFLAQLVCGIGDSKKKSVPWLNGRSTTNHTNQNGATSGFHTPKAVTYHAPTVM